MNKLVERSYKLRSSLQTSFSFTNFVQLYKLRSALQTSFSFTNFVHLAMQQKKPG